MTTSIYQNFDITANQLDRTIEQNKMTEAIINNRLDNDQFRSLYTKNFINPEHPNDPLRMKYNYTDYKENTKYYYPEVFLRQIDTPSMKDQYGNDYEEGRDNSLIDTVENKLINVGAYNVENNAVKRFSQAISQGQKTPSNAFDFKTFARVENRDFDYKLLEAIKIYNNKNRNI